MKARIGNTQLVTHDVTNQTPPLFNINLFEFDVALKEGLIREGASWAMERAQKFGKFMGSEHCINLAFEANRHLPELKTFDRYGCRIDKVEYHPAYHELMSIAIENGIHSIAWTNNKGGHVAHIALEYIFGQIEQGVCCPITMTYAVIPALRHQSEVAKKWEQKILANKYDHRFIPVTEKHGLTLGMAMTEKQGGSDVRANTTQAHPIDHKGSGEAYELVGHKWFCSAPMSDAFLTLAQTEVGLSCFLVPRWKPDGILNTIFIQRLKDKLGNRSNASAEIEYHQTHAIMVGEDGRGINTIIEMVHHTRLDASMAPAALMRQALIQAIHHAKYRQAFGKALIKQPLMRSVLADLAIESEAATTLLLRVARAFDESSRDSSAKMFSRIAVAVSKYWLNKRAPNFIYEALEAHGGNGYVEESIMPRLYREAPLNSIWEGSGNVICLDVLRAIVKQPESVQVFLDEVEHLGRENKFLQNTISEIKILLSDKNNLEIYARRLCELMALSLQGALLLQYAPNEIADCFCNTRLNKDWGYTYGTLPKGVSIDKILNRAWSK
jgi:putative acyl-CoA dehydrogenase